MIGEFVGDKPRVVKISSLVRPGTKKDREAERVRNAATGLGTSVPQVGLLHMPIVRRVRVGWEVVTGLHRITAAESAGQKTIPVRVWKGTDAERDVLRSEENTRRRHLSGDELREAVDRGVGYLRNLSGFAIASTESSHEDTERRDETTSQRVKVRAALAKAEGISHATLAKRDQRAKAEAPAAAPVSADQNGRGAAAKALEFTTPFEDFGIAMSEHERAETLLLIDQLKEWEAGTTRLLGELTRLEKASELPVLAPALAAGIREDARRLGHALRNAVPCGRCYYCKGKPELRAACYACGGTGLAGRQSGNDVPKELRAGGAGARVAVNGRFVPYHEVAPAEVARPKANGKPKGIRIVDADDRELTVELDAEERY